MNPIRIVVPWDVHRTSPNQRLHWRERHVLNKQARMVARIAWAAAGSPRVDGPVRVSMIVRRGRMIDQDNAIGGSKALRDGIFNFGITPGDSPKWVRLGGVEFECGKQWKDCPEVEFVVEPL